MPGWFRWDKRTTRKRALTLAVSAAMLGLLFFGAACQEGERVPPGVKVWGREVGGLAGGEAVLRLEGIAAEVASRPVRVFFGGWEASTNYGRLGVRLEVAATMQKALGKGRKLLSLRQGLEIPPVLSLDRTLFREELKRLAGDLEQEPLNAALNIDPVTDVISIRPARSGRKIDLEQATAAFLEALPAGGPSSLFLAFREISPAFSTEEVRAMGITGLLSGFSTAFDPTVKDRATNIRLAASALDGLLIAPGETFSFNQAVGPRLEEAGYREAKVIQENRFVQGVGGGVCQVSSTLYNAVLLAGFPVVERSRHSLQVDYVPPGRDATVAYEQVDLKFANNSEGFLVLKAWVKEGRLMMKIFGPAGELPRVRVWEVIEERIPPGEKLVPDPTLQPGQRVLEKEGRSGFRVRVLRQLRGKGGLEREEVVSRDTYPPEDRLIRVAPEVFLGGFIPGNR